MWSCSTEIKEVLLLNECTSSSCCRKINVRLPLSNLCAWYPEALSTLHYSEFSQRWRKGSVHRLFLYTACNHRQYMVQNVTSFIFMQFMTESRWIHGGFGPQKCFIPIHLKGAKPLLKTGVLDRIQITDNLCTTTKCRFTSLLMNLGGTSYTVWYIWLLHW